MLRRNNNREISVFSSRYSFKLVAYQEVKLGGLILREHALGEALQVRSGKRLGVGFRKRTLTDGGFSRTIPRRNCRRHLHRNPVRCTH